MTVDTILFDLDGTLVQHGHVLLPDQLAAWGHPRPLEAVDAAFAVQIQWFYEYAKTISGTELDTEATWRQTWPRMYQGVLSHLGIEDRAMVDQMVAFFAADPTPPLFEDVLPLMDTLAEDSWRLGIITQRPRRGAVQYLAEHGLLDRFDVIVAGDDGFGRKPSPGPFRRALEVLGRSSQQAIYIGDRIDDDCGGAHGAGLRAFLIDRQQVYNDDAGNGESTYVRLRSLLDLLDHLSSGEVMEESQCLSLE